MAVKAPEVRNLPLILDHSRPSGSRLRNFLAGFASCRSRLALPPVDEILTSRGIGIDLEGELTVSSLHEALQRIPYVLALPEQHFQKTNPKFVTRLEALACKRESKADCLAGLLVLSNLTFALLRSQPLSLVAA